MSTGAEPRHVQFAGGRVGQRGVRQVAEDERLRIIEAAYTALGATSGAAVSVSEILAAAGLSTRAFYRHFDSKDGLLMALLRQETEAMQLRLQAAVDAAPAPPEQLRAWIAEFLRVSSTPRRRQRALLFASGEVTRARGYAAERDRMRAAHEQGILAVLGRGLRDGSFPWAVLPSDAKAIRSVIDRVFEEQIRGVGVVGADEAAEQVVDFAFRALGVRAGRGIGR